MLPETVMQATRDLIPAVSRELNRDDRVVFAYLYGSVAEDGIGRDMDIAMYSQPGIDTHFLAADLKIALHTKTGLSPDLFDIRIINTLAQEGDIFTLLYLQRVLSTIKIKGVPMPTRIFIYAFMPFFLFILSACATTDTANRSTVVLEVPGCG